MEGKYERMLNKRIANKETEDKKSVSTYANVGRYINEKKKKERKEERHVSATRIKYLKNQKSKNSCRKEKKKEKKRIMQCDFHREIR